MGSITIKNIPEQLLDRVRQRAAADHRSVNKEFIQLVETALRGEQAGPVVREQIARQTAAWAEFAGRWASDVNVAAETRAIYEARTAGRPVDL